MTNVASTEIGMYFTKLPRRKYPHIIKIPVYKLECHVLAPDETLRDERVNEPDAGMPQKRAQPKFPTPNEIAALSPLILSPSLEARDFPIDNPSIRQSKASANEVKNEI